MIRGSVARDSAPGSLFRPRNSTPRNAGDGSHCNWSGHKTECWVAKGCLPLRYHALSPHCGGRKGRVTFKAPLSARHMLARGAVASDPGHTLGGLSVLEGEPTETGGDALRRDLHVHTAGTHCLLRISASDYRLQVTGEFFPIPPLLPVRPSACFYQPTGALLLHHLVWPGDQHMPPSAPSTHASLATSITIRSGEQYRRHRLVISPFVGVPGNPCACVYERDSEMHHPESQGRGGKAPLSARVQISSPLVLHLPSVALRYLRVSCE